VQAAAVRAVAPDFTPPADLTRDPVYLLTQTYWLPVTLESAFARFDYMSLWLPRAFVDVWSWLVAVSVAAVVAWVLREAGSLNRRRRVHLGVYLGLLLMVVGAFAEDVVYTLSAGNSPQGRYLLFASPAFFLLVGLAAERTLGRAAWCLCLVPLFLAFANLWSYIEVIRPAYS
jgi:hypothetical protein